MAKVAYANEKFYPKKTNELGMAGANTCRNIKSTSYAYCKTKNLQRHGKAKKGMFYVVRSSLLRTFFLVFYSHSEVPMSKKGTPAVVYSSAFEKFSKGSLFPVHLKAGYGQARYQIPSDPNALQNSKALQKFKKQRSILGTGETTKTCDQKA